MSRRLLSLIAIGLITVILAFSFITYELGAMRSNAPSSTPSSSPLSPPSNTPASTPSTVPSNALWQTPIKNFATALTVDDGKVFTTDETGDVYCFDSQNGKSIWNSTPGHYPSGGVLASEGRVYVGLGEGKVGCLDENNGLPQWTLERRYFQYPDASPQIRLKDGRVYAIADGIGAYDAVTGALLWQEASGKIASSDETWSVSGSTLNGDPVDANYVYALTGNFSSMPYFKLNTDDGSILWLSDVVWNGTVLTWGVDYGVWAPHVLAIRPGQVIVKTVFNGTSASYMLFALDSNTGKELWSIDLGADIYDPIAYSFYYFFQKLTATSMP